MQPNHHITEPSHLHHFCLYMFVFNNDPIYQIIIVLQMYGHCLQCVSVVFPDHAQLLFDPSQCYHIISRIQHS